LHAWVEEWSGYRTYLWSRTDATSKQYELRAPEDRCQPLATLAIGGSSTVAAHVDSNERRLIFTQEGRVRQRTRIIDTTTRTVVASFERGWIGRRGRVWLARGAQIDWRRQGVLHPAAEFTDHIGVPLLVFNTNGKVLTTGLGPHLEPTITSWEELLILLTLGWFLVTIDNTATPARQISMG
jgi:hypothetical protein